MTTIQELKAQVEREKAEAAAVYAFEAAERQERERKERQDALVRKLSDIGLVCIRSATDSSVEIEGYVISMRSQYVGGEFGSWFNWLYVQKGRSITINREVGRNTLPSDLLDMMAETDELDRLDNRPYVEKLLADINAGAWDDNFALADEAFAPWRDELTAAWDAWLAEHNRRQDELNKPQPTVAELLKRIEALEARFAELDATEEDLANAAFGGPFYRIGIPVGPEGEFASVSLTVSPELVSPETMNALTEMVHAAHVYAHPEPATEQPAPITETPLAEPDKLKAAHRRVDILEKGLARVARLLASVSEDGDRRMLWPSIEEARVIAYQYLEETSEHEARVELGLDTDETEAQS